VIHAVTPIDFGNSGFESLHFGNRTASEA